MKEVLPLKISLQRTVPLCLFPLSIVRFWFVSFFFCFVSLFLSNDTSENSNGVAMPLSHIPAVNGEMRQNTSSGT